MGRANFISLQAEANKTFHESQVPDGWSASGSADAVIGYANYQAQLKQNAANAKAFAQLKEYQRKQAEQNLMVARMDLESTKELAMFTGRIVMQRELWTTGQRLTK